MDEIPLAVVTGAGHRLGRTLALTLARLGYALLLHYNSSREEAERTAAEARSFEIPVYPCPADLSGEAGITALIAAIGRLPHPLRLLVNSAAIMPPADLRTISAHEWDRVMNLNLRTPFLLAREAAGIMPAGGLIVNITDAGAHKLWTRYPAYVVSKSALETLTRLLAKALAPSIRVNAIAPGLVLPGEDLPAEEWSALVDRLPLKRPVSPHEVASALEFLLRNEAVTGETIVVDAGYSLL